MALTTLTYDLSGGNGDVVVNTQAKTIDFISFQLDGNGSVDGTATIKLQEANTAGGTFKDVAGASAVANVSTSEYVDGGKVNSAFFNFNIVVGTATAGIVTMVLNYR